MRITKYTTLLQDQVPALVKEKSINYCEQSQLDNPQKITDMLNSVFHLSQQTEEHVYLVCLSSKSTILGVFEISHGGANYSYASNREIFMKAMLCGAVNIILAHNHPSGFCEPSIDDINLTRRVKEAGNLMNIPLADHIILGHNNYYSFREHKLEF